MEIIIRAYIKTDRNSCLDAFKTNVPKYFTEKEIEDFDFFLTRIEKGDEQMHYYVVVYEQKIIGCGGFGEKDDHKVISLAWGLIHKDYHKKGLGKKLLLYRMEQIKKLSPEYSIIIDTTQYAYTFFEKFGFYTTKITSNYYAIGMHRYDMLLKI
jgi:N-acetylglutamate synthase-like GNAT family acetyltransferase